MTKTHKTTQNRSLQWTSDDGFIALILVCAIIAGRFHLGTAIVMVPLVTAIICTSPKRNIFSRNLFSLAPRLHALLYQIGKGSLEGMWFTAFFMATGVISLVGYGRLAYTYSSHVLLDVCMIMTPGLLAFSILTLMPTIGMIIYQRERPKSINDDAF